MRRQTPGIKQLQFARGRCFGPCPVYQVTLTADGTVAWQGEAFVKVIGPASWSIPASQVARIEAALDAARFKDLTMENSVMLKTCQATCYIKVEYSDGFCKCIEDYLGSNAPPELRLLEKRLDMLLGTAPYIGQYPWV